MFVNYQQSSNIAGRRLGSHQRDLDERILRRQLGHRSTENLLELWRTGMVESRQQQYRGAPEGLLAIEYAHPEHQQ